VMWSADDVEAARVVVIGLMALCDELVDSGKGRL